MSRAQILLEKLDTKQSERMDEGLGKALKAGIKLGIIGYIGYKASKPVLGFLRQAGKPVILAWMHKHGVTPDIIEKLQGTGLTVKELLPKGGF